MESPSLSQVNQFESSKHPSWKDKPLPLPVPWISESCIKIKINLDSYFHTSLFSRNMKTQIWKRTYLEKENQKKNIFMIKKLKETL